MSYNKFRILIVSAIILGWVVYAVDQARAGYYITNVTRTRHCVTLNYGNDRRGIILGKQLWAVYLEVHACRRHHHWHHLHVRWDEETNATWQWGGWHYRQTSHHRRFTVRFKAEFDGLTVLPYVEEHNYPTGRVTIGPHLRYVYHGRCGC